MIHLALPDSNTRALAFYLAMEEWAVMNMPPDDYFFAWRVNPTVICGRNQDIRAEVNIEYCNQEGIDIVRRRSGGGCVYADLNNWMFSYLTPSSEVASTFSRYTLMIAGMLQSLGFDAKANGRNDILIGERKVAGNAFYHKPAWSIVHGTMLCEIDAERMRNAITPSRAKLESKAVKSVEARITCLRAEGLAMSVEEFGQYAVASLTSGNARYITQEEIREIECLEKKYYEPAYLWGQKPAKNKASSNIIRKEARFENAGEIHAEIELSSDSTIASLNITGDFFLLDDINAKLITPLQGIKYDREALDAKLQTLRPQDIIAGLTSNALLSLLI